MTWYAIVQSEDGRLVSGTDDATKIATPEILEARGYVVIEQPDGAQNGVWNADSRSFDPAPTAAAIIKTADDIIAAFTPIEWAAAKAAMAGGDAQLIWFFDRLMVRPDGIDVAGQTFQGGLQYLAAKNLITADRPAAITKTLIAGA